MVSYPIIGPAEGEDLDPQWGIDVTDALNDHESRIGTIEDPPWFNFTPTWNAATTDPTLSNTTLISRYQYTTSKQILWIVRYEMGAGSSKGSGAYDWDLPVPPVNSTARGATGSWIMNDSGMALRSGIAMIEFGVLELFQGGASSSRLTSTVLTGTFTASWLQWQISYEVA